MGFLAIKGGRGALPILMLKSIGIGSITYGALVMSNAAGYLLIGADTAGCKFEGISAGGGTATANGEFDVPVYAAGVFKLKNSATQALVQANVGGHAYIEDYETVCKSAGSTNKVRVGIVEGIDTDGVWVSIRTEVFKESPDLENAGDDELDLTGVDGDAVAIAPTGAVGTVWDTAAPTTVVTAIDRIASEAAFLPGGPIQQTPRLASVYVNAATGVDANPGTAALPVLTMDRAMELVPPYGFCSVYVTGDPAWAGGGAVPYEGYRGHLRVFATNAFTDAGGGADTVTAYVAAAGVYGEDTLTPTALVPADATDRSRFVEITEDVGAGGATHLVRVLEEITGVWQLEPRGLTVTGANAIALLEPTSTLAPVAAISASSLHNEGDVMLIGFNVTSPGADGITGLTFAACVLDATADVHAINQGPNTSFGGISTNAAIGAVAPAAYVPAAALVGSALEDLVAADAELPGCHITMAGGASVLRMIASSAPGAGRIVGTVWEAGDIYVGNPESHLVMAQSRGPLAADGLQVMDGATVTMGLCQTGDIVQSDDAHIILTGAIGATSVNHDGNIKAAGVGAAVDINIVDAVKLAATSDTYAFVGGPHSRRQGIVITGTMWAAATACPAVSLDGWSEDVDLVLPASQDHGAGDYAEIAGGYHYLGTCSGDNVNAGGTGMSLLGLGTRASVANGFSITGNGGGTTTVGVGSLGHIALPAGGAVANDFAAAGAITGVEQCCIIEHRA